jgi:hypothetical protein
MDLQEYILKQREERLQRTEQSLIESGLDKCKVCNMWAERAIIQEGKCCDCREVRNERV